MGDESLTELRRLQLTELEILKVVDKICTDNSIQYSLFAGTLLGAVRHNGFIPWDDDLDIAMRRSDYEKFISIWSELNPSGYILQNKDNTPDFPQSFTKIRKDYTTFLQYEWEKGKYHTGIFVDIFPIDRIPNGILNKLLFYIRCAKYQIYTRENNHSLDSGFLTMIVKFLLFFSNKKSRSTYRNKFIEKLRISNKKSSFNCISIETLSSIRKEFSSQLCEDYSTIEFEGEQFMCFKDWEHYLSTFYGDYMRLPPINERTWSHHPIVIDFKHNLDEI